MGLGSELDLESEFQVQNKGIRLPAGKQEENRIQFVLIRSFVSLESSYYIV